jgi:DnaJ domain
MGPDLYAALDLPRDAPPDAIRRAYRRAAKRAHPDTGGSATKFALVKLAHDTLGDANRRAHYDATGEAEDKPVDNHRATVLEMISAGLDQAMAKLYDRAKPPIHVDMVRETRTAMSELRRKWAEEASELRKNIDRSQELCGRWSSVGENVMEVIATHRVKYLQSCLAVVDRRIALMDEALSMLDGAAFRADPEPPAERRDGFAAINFGTMRMWG